MASIYDDQGNEIDEEQRIDLNKMPLSEVFFDWDYGPNNLYTVIIYDQDADDFLHYLTVNIPEMNLEQGQELVPYIPPNPPKSDRPHLYIFSVYRQSGPKQIRDIGVPIRSLVGDSILIDSVSFYASFGSNQKNPGNRKKRSISWSNPLELPKNEQKYCSCVLKVADKQSPECLNKRLWGQEDSEGKTCYNPYAVCGKSVGTSSRRCGESYDYEELTDEFLEAYARLSRIPIPKTRNRKELLDRIYAWKQQK